MPTDAERTQFNRLRLTPDVTSVVPPVPKLPDDVVKRFPSLRKWHDDMEQWRIKTNIAIRGGPQ